MRLMHHLGRKGSELPARSEGWSKGRTKEQRWGWRTIIGER